MVLHHLNIYFKIAVFVADSTHFISGDVESEGYLIIDIGIIKIQSLLRASSDERSA